MRSLPSLNLTTLVLLSAVATTTAEPAQATVVVIHPLDEMAHRADVVMHAVVREQKIVREEGRIVTLTKVEILDAIKGVKLGDVETIFQVGGKIDTEVVTVVGTSHFKVGEEMVYFAMRHRDRLVSYGVGVGKFRIDRDAQTVSVREEFGDVVAVDPKAPRAGVYKPKPREQASLAALIAKIRADLSQPAPASMTRPRLRPHQKRLLQPRAEKLYRRGRAPVDTMQNPSSHQHQ